ncbi:MAG: PEP-CTERM sorting domain-containing protein [Chromatiales bacterium]|jgi:hypothetical protein
MERIFIRSLSAVALLFSFGIVNAAYMPCPGSIAGSVEGAVDCQYSDSDDQDFTDTDPMTVNVDPGLFGIDTWQFLGQDTSPDGTLGFSGDWVMPDTLWSEYENIMLVFKGGVDTTLVGYLLDGVSTSGGWVSPFTYPAFDVMTTKAVSHISYYATEDAVPDPNAPVPEPQTALLFGLGLIGLVYGRKRKKF